MSAHRTPVTRTPDRKVPHRTPVRPLVAAAVLLAVVLGAAAVLASPSPTVSTARITPVTPITAVPSSPASTVRAAASAALTAAHAQSFCQNITSIASSLAASVATAPSSVTEADVARVDLNYAVVFTTAGEYAVAAAQYAPSLVIGQHVAHLASDLGAVSTTLLAAHDELVAHPRLTARQFSANKTSVSRALSTFLNRTLSRDLLPVSPAIQARCATTTTTTVK